MTVAPAVRRQARRLGALESNSQPVPTSSTATTAPPSSPSTRQDHAPPSISHSAERKIDTVPRPPTPRRPARYFSQQVRLSDSIRCGASPTTAAGTGEPLSFLLRSGNAGRTPPPITSRWSRPRCGNCNGIDQEARSPSVPMLSRRHARVRDMAGWEAVVVLGWVQYSFATVVDQIPSRDGHRRRWGSRVTGRGSPTSRPARPLVWQGMQVIVRKERARTRRAVRLTDADRPASSRSPPTRQAARRPRLRHAAGPLRGPHPQLQRDTVQQTAATAHKTRSGIVTRRRTHRGCGCSPSRARRTGGAGRCSHGCSRSPGASPATADSGALPARALAPWAPLRSRHVDTLHASRTGLSIDTDRPTA